MEVYELLFKALAVSLYSYFTWSIKNGEKAIFFFFCFWKSWFLKRNWYKYVRQRGNSWNLSSAPSGWNTTQCLYCYNTGNPFPLWDFSLKVLHLVTQAVKSSPKCCSDDNSREIMRMMQAGIFIASSEMLQGRSPSGWMWTLFFHWWGSLGADCVCFKDAWKAYSPCNTTSVPLTYTLRSFNSVLSHSNINLFWYS